MSDPLLKVNEFSLKGDQARANILHSVRRPNRTLCPTTAQRPPALICMASKYTISGRRRFLGCRNTLFLAAADFTMPEIHYFRPSQACMAPIYSISTPSRLAWLRYTVYQPQAGLHGSDIQYINPKQACRAPIYSISTPSRLAWPDIQYFWCRAEQPLRPIY